MHRRTLLIHLRRRHVVVKCRPARLHADRPSVRRVRIVREPAVAADRARRRRTDLRQGCAARHFQSGVRLTHGIIRRDDIGSMRERVCRAVRKRQIVLLIRKLICQRKLRGGRQTDDLVQSGDGDIVVILDIYEILLGVRE